MVARLKQAVHARFYVACAESASELRVGAIVRGNVLWETQAAHTRLVVPGKRSCLPRYDEEYPDKDSYYRCVGVLLSFDYLFLLL